jgi:PHS family inorganic phosphate transporter-like MFS transporter
MYPNGAAISAEGVEEGEDSAERVGWSFFWQTPGSFSPYIVGYALLLLPASLPALTSIQFRFLLALGALPAAVVFVAVYGLREAPRGESESVNSSVAISAPAAGPAASRGGLGALKEAIAQHPEYLRTLSGTASTWCLYDVSYYGTVIFTPQILGQIFTSSETLSDLFWQSLAVAGFGLLGILAAIPAMRRFGGTWLSLWGFVMMGVAFAAFGVLFALSPSGLTGVKFGVFCLMSFSQSWGCNLSTYVLPTQLFPREVRATFHGLSAASGKVGAVIGTFLFAPVLASLGIVGVMWCQVAVCIAGVLCTHFLLPDASPSKLAAARSGATAASFNGEVELDDAVDMGDESDESAKSLLRS